MMYASELKEENQRVVSTNIESEKNFGNCFGSDATRRISSHESFIGV